MVYLSSKYNKQECIPVGCVQSAAVAISWGRVSAREGVFAQGYVGCLPRGSVCLGVVSALGMSAWGWV